MSNIGIVIIGRNEGQRLVRCLHSVAGTPAIVYVDSGSTDDSVANARTFGASVVTLDPTIRFSAARARNAGFHRLRELAPDVEYVQFVDGDCEVVSGWLERGMAELASHEDFGIVCGHTIELHPEASVYNMLCDLEWQRDPGEVRACGGIFMVRTEPFARHGGFREDVIAAEDDELCLRLRRAGMKVVQVDAKMVLHDAAIYRFSQWWTRAKRAGHAFAQGAALHGRSHDRHFVPDCRRIWLWAVVVPMLAGIPAYWTHGASLLLLGGYPLLTAKIYRYGRQRGWARRAAGAYAVFNVLAKLPGLLGMLQYYSNRARGRHPVLIEYKGADASGGPTPAGRAGASLTT